MAISDLDYTDDSDVALIRRTRTGDNDAYGILHQRHVGSARALAWRMSRSVTDADDLVSEGFARVLAALQRGSGPEVAFRPYLLSTIRRLAYDRTNREKREAPVEYDLDEPTTPAGDPVVEGFERDTAAAAFASLPERWRMVLWHTEVEGQSPAQVADLLGIKPNAVAALAYRAREGLRQAYLGQHATMTPAGTDECRLTNDRLAAYVRGGLTPTQEARAREHLESCDDCRAAYLELASVNTSMRSLIGLVVLGPAAGGYLAELASPTMPVPVGSVGSTVARAARASRHARLVAVAAVVVLAAVGGALAAGHSSDRQLALGQRTAEDRRAPSATGSEPGRADPVSTTSTPSDRAEPTDPPAAADDTTGTRAAEPATEAGSGSGATLPDPRAADPLPDPTIGRSGSGSGPTPTTTPTSTPALSGPATTAPPVIPPPTTVPPPPVAVPSKLAVALHSAGGLVAGKPGVLVATVDNAGAGAGRAVQVDVDLVGATLRGLPHVASGTTLARSRSGSRATGGGWTCVALGVDRLRCTRDQLAAGAASTIYVPIAVASATPVQVSARATGTDDQAGPGASPSIQLPVSTTGMAARFATIDRGAIRTAGNTLLSCDLHVTGCADARAGIGAPASLSNDAFPMVPVDVDGDPTTTNSSSAALAIPAGAEVLSAQLYQGGDVSGGPGGLPAPDPAAAGQLTVRTPQGTVAHLTPERVDHVGNRYQAVHDVTDLVAAGGSGTWTVGGAQLGTGENMFGGWSLVVVYADAREPVRSLVVLDGFSEVTTTPQPTDQFDVGGFAVPASGTSHATIDVVAYEGDRGLTGDQLTVGGHALTDAGNPLGNSFNSSASDLGTAVLGLGPAATNLFGLDIDRFDLAGVLPPGATSTRVALTTSSDVYLPGVVAISVDQ